MKRIAILFLLPTLFFCTSEVVHGQDDKDDVHDVVITIPEVALLDIETSGAGTSITLGPDAPTEAGLGLDFSNETDNTLWLNYSSIIKSGNDNDRDVSVAITNGTMPGGMTLSVVAAADAGNGDGTVGTPTAQIDLSATDQNIITGIGSCYTGDGASNGHQLTYTLSQTSGNYGDLDADDATTIQVTYTISDN